MIKKSYKSDILQRSEEAKSQKDDSRVPIPKTSVPIRSQVLNTVAYFQINIFIISVFYFLSACVQKKVIKVAFFYEANSQSIARLRFHFDYKRTHLLVELI